MAAEWLGVRAYPQKRLNDAWTLVMGGQFHDIMAGTATPQAYNFSWNDDVIALNQFSVRAHERNRRRRIGHEHRRARHSSRRVQPSQYRTRGRGGSERFVRRQHAERSSRGGAGRQRHTLSARARRKRLREGSVRRQSSVGWLRRLRRSAFRPARGVELRSERD